MEEEQPLADEVGSPSHQSDRPVAESICSTSDGRIDGDCTTDAQQITDSTALSASTAASPNAVLGSSARRGMIECPVCGETFTRTFLLRRHQAEQCGIKCLRCNAVVPEPQMEKHLLTSHGLPAGLKRTSDAESGPVTKTFVLCDKTLQRQEVQFHQLSGVIHEGYTCTVRKASDEAGLTHDDTQEEVRVTPIKVLVGARVHPLAVPNQTLERGEAVESAEVHSRDQANEDGEQEAESETVPGSFTTETASPDHNYGQPESPAALSVKPSQMTPAVEEPMVSLVDEPTPEGNSATGGIPQKNESSDDLRSEDENLPDLSADAAVEPVIESRRHDSPTCKKKPVCCGERFDTTDDFRRHVITSHIFKCSFCKKSFVSQSQHRNHEKLQHQQQATKSRTKRNDNNSSKTAKSAASKGGGGVQPMMKCRCGAPYKTQRSLDKHMDRCSWSAREAGQIDSNRRKAHQQPTEKAISSSVSGVAAAKKSSIFIVRTAGSDADDSVSSATSMVTKSDTPIAYQPGETLRCETCKLIFEKPEAAERHRALVHTLRPTMFRHSAAMFGSGQRRNVIVTGLRGAPLPKETQSLQCRFCPKTFRTKQTLLTHCSKYHEQSVPIVV